MDVQPDATLFLQKKIRPTANRLLIWQKIQAFDYAFGLADLQDALPQLDKSTLFRTLMLFVGHQLLHAVDDGSNSQKFCVCHCFEGHHHESHVHLTCRICQKTYCLRMQQIPVVSLPEGFYVEEVSYVVKGVCPHCRKKITRLSAY